MGNTDLGDHLLNAQKNATYLSSVSVEEFMKVLNTYIEEKIHTALKLSKHFVILADECQDESGREQLAIFVRYIIESSSEVREDYIALVNLNDAEDKLESRTAKD